MIYSKTGRALLVALTITVGFLPLFASALPPQISLSDLLARSRFSQLKLSPNGKHLAALAPVSGRTNLIVIELATMKSSALTSLQTLDVSSFAWVNNDRLIFMTHDSESGSGGQEQFYSGAGGIQAIDREGGHLRELVASPLRQTRRDRFLAVEVSVVIEYGTLIRTLNDGSDDIILSITRSARRSADHLELFRVNTRNGHREPMSFKIPANIVRHVLDGQNVLRAVQNRNKEGTVDTLWYRENADSDWIKLEEFATEGPDTLTPVAFDSDNKTLLVLSRHGRDTEALFTYDTTARKLGEQLVAPPARGHHPLRSELRQTDS